MQMKKRIQATYTKLKIHRWIAWLLCAALMGGMVSTALPALAVNGEREEGTLCEHHSEHTEECGYVEAVKGQPCAHIHDDQCGYVGGGSAAIECTHEHDEECGYVEAESCTHEHDDECGYTEAVGAVEGEPCTHEHDEDCGYVEAVEGQPCQFVCAICGELEEVTDEDSEQDVAVMADQPIAPRAVQEEGLIAHFTFDNSTDRLYDYSGKGVTAGLYETHVWEDNYTPTTEITGTALSNYFNGTGENKDALHLDDSACLVVDETADFNDMTEMTVEMRIKIVDRGIPDEEKKDRPGYDAHWLFYAAKPNSTRENRKLGVVLTNDQQLRILREDLDETIKKIYKDVNDDAVKNRLPEPYPNQYDEAPYPDGYSVDDWNTIRIIYKPSNIALYVNDTRIVDYGLGSKTSDCFHEDWKLWFGHSLYNDANFNGYIDDIKIYNYANYKKSGGGYLDGYIDESKYIMESVDPPNTTVHMFDYWIDEDGGQIANDFDPPLTVDYIRSHGINKDHLLLFAGYNAATDRNVNRTSYVGSWNAYQYSDNGNHETYEPFQGIVDNVLDSGYPRLDIEGLKDKGRFMIPSNDRPNDRWYENNVGGPTESLAYLFEPSDDKFKKAYRNVTGLFRVNPENGDYIFRCAETFAELNREQRGRPKVSTGNNRITLYRRSSLYKDFFFLNDATDLFHITMDHKLDHANIAMGVQATTDEPFNHYFGMTVETTFAQTTDGLIDLPGGRKEPMSFYFSGDDDVWIFIDDVLVADVGGLHSEVGVNIDFSTGVIDFTGDVGNVGKEKPLDGTDIGGRRFDITLKEMFEKAYEDHDIEWNENMWNPNNNEIFADGSKHTLKFFYLERGNSVSRCTIEFNLQHAENVAEEHTHKKRSSSEELPVEPLFEEFVTLDVSTEEPPKKKEEAKTNGVLASPNTGDSNMVGLWLALLALSTAGLAAIQRTRKRGSK